jgi:hypothetical protein
MPTGHNFTCKEDSAMRKKGRKHTVKHVIMIAAENDALASGKVGGIGKVTRSADMAVRDRNRSLTNLRLPIPRFKAGDRVLQALRDRLTLEVIAGRHFMGNGK